VKKLFPAHPSLLLKNPFLHAKSQFFDWLLGLFREPKSMILSYGLLFFMAGLMYEIS